MTACSGGDSTPGSTTTVPTTTAPASTSGDGSSAPTASSSGDDGAAVFSATLTQSRPDEGTRTINAELTDAGTTDASVVSVELRSPGFVDAGPTTKDTTFSPGQIIDLTTDYGDPVCDAANQTVRSATFIVGLADGSEQTLDVDRPGVAWLGRLHARECGVRAIDEAAKFRFGDSFTRTKVGGILYLGGDLVVRRPTHGDAVRPAVKVNAMIGSVLITLRPAPSTRLPYVLSPDQSVARVPILIGGFRCDAHALAGSTQTLLLSVYAQLAGSSQQRLILEPDHALQVQIFSLIDDVCSA